MAYPIYDVVLLPPQGANNQAITLSRQLSTQYPTQFTLSDTLYPHVSLYMANLSPEGVQEAAGLLAQLSQKNAPCFLEASYYDQNEHGMFEVFFEKTPELTVLQQQIITLLNPLRIGLRQIDPVGRELTAYIEEAPPEARANLQQFGYDEVGKFFKPHITLTRLSLGSPSVVTSNLSKLSTFNGAYSTLALCEMGEHGTCIKIVAQFECGSPAA